jgi:NAD-reducing hydrogenase large subunit
MAKTIVIDPVTRIEGHAKITIHLDGRGRVKDAQFHVTQFRGFEKFTEGRPFEEMPAITARICGICPVSHQLASSKAGDDLMAVRIPPAAENLRRMLNLGQYIQSHALSFFHLSGPDLLLGMDSPPAQRNVLGLAAADPALARDGIWLRKFGQQIIERLAGKRIHPAWTVPGGVNQPMSAQTRDPILEGLPRGLRIVEAALGRLKGIVDRFADEIDSFANFPTLFMGLVTADGSLEHYDGFLRIVDADRKIVADRIPAGAYADFIGEAPVPWSYLKSPYYKPLGPEQGAYRVGPLARLNVADRCGTPRADRELAEFRTLGTGAVLSSFHYHYARLIELLYAFERLEGLLRDPETLSPKVRAVAGPNRTEGVGITEAPRGVLVHHYRIDDHGLMRWANLIVATGHNNIAMSRGVRQVAQRFVSGKRLQEGALNRVEAVIRCYDPCLSCSTHALGQMPLLVQLVDPDGRIVDERRRSSGESGGEEPT